MKTKSGSVFLLPLCVAMGVLLVTPAAWPQCNPLLDVEKIVGNTTNADDAFGIEVEIRGGVVVVGAQSAENQAPGGGAAFVFRDTGMFTQEALLVANDAGPGDGFGKSVSIDGNVIAVGARFADAGGGVGDAGAAYVYRFNTGVWMLEQKLTASDADTGNEYGGSVSVGGDVIVVGDRFGDTGVAGAGCAYVYRHDGAVWQEEAILFSGSPEATDEFGRNVAIDGDVIVVGAPADDDRNPNAGACYVYRFDGASWQEEAKLLADDGDVGDFLGIEVFVDGDVIIAGASGDDVAGTDSGSAYIFRFDAMGWNQEDKLTPSDPAAGDRFGISVAVSGGTAIVGADRNDENGMNSGAAYKFIFGGGQWIEDCKLTAFDGANTDRYGFSVSVDDDSFAVGAFRNDAAGDNAGAAYVYTVQGVVSGVTFLRGDVNLDGFVDVSDAIFLANWLLGSGPAGGCEESADIDGDGVLNGIVDSIFLLNFLFQNGDPVAPPFPDCGLIDAGLCLMSTPACP